MTAKQFLNRARRIDREISQLLELKQHTRDRLTNITQTLTADIVSGSHDPHKLDKLVELESEIDNKVDDLVSVKTEIYRTLCKLPDRNQRLVLIAYYLDMTTWEQIAVNMNYSYQHIMWIRKKAIEEVDAIIKDKIE